MQQKGITVTEHRLQAPEMEQTSVFFFQAFLVLSRNMPVDFFRIGSRTSAKRHLKQDNPRGISRETQEVMSNNICIDARNANDSPYILVPHLEVWKLPV